VTGLIPPGDEDDRQPETRDFTDRIAQLDTFADGESGTRLEEQFSNMETGAVGVAIAAGGRWGRLTGIAPLSSRHEHEGRRSTTG